MPHKQCSKTAFNTRKLRTQIHCRYLNSSSLLPFCCLIVFYWSELKKKAWKLIESITITSNEKKQFTLKLLNHPQKCWFEHTHRCLLYVLLFLFRLDLVVSREGGKANYLYLSLKLIDF